MKRIGNRGSWGRVCALGLLAGQAAALAAPSCRPALTDLGTLGGAYSVATAIDDKGHVIGFSSTAAGLEHAFLHKGMAMSDLADKMPLDLRALPSRADAINSSGQIAGTLNDKQMWRYTPATRRLQVSAYPIYLNMPSYCRVNGMAADGALVGRSGNDINDPYVKSGFVAVHPETVYAVTDHDAAMYAVCDTYQPAMNALGDVTWQGAGGAAQPPAEPKGGEDAYSLRYSPNIWSFEHAPRVSVGDVTRAELSLKRLNDARKAAATAYDLAYCGYRWMVAEHRLAMVFNAAKRTYRNLGPGLFGPEGQSAAYAISEGSKLVVGTSAPAGPACEVTGTATLFTNLVPGSQATPVNVAPTGNVTDSRAYAVTRRGQVLGDALIGTRRRPFVYAAPVGTHLLDKLFPALSEIEADLFQNERGQIAGTAIIDGQRRAFRIDCPTGS